ncbi:LysR substrate-binding domain-containing protein [Bdellovibrio bacteriovorus]|uniref:LysR substrate-binding domain-containing protein n=1 Tax=Bdellovibrio bacteriovorus TaxID=959 RepID=UPI0035A64FE6
MDLSKLKAFVVVAEELNFRKSAEILGMSQPPLTRLIASLEEELGTSLFERTTRHVKLTGAGVFLLKEGKEILNRAQGLESEIRALGKMKAGKISIAFSSTGFLANLPKIIREFQDRFPKIKIELQQETRSAIVKGLKSGRFDAGFLEGSLKEENFQFHSVQDENLGVLLPKNHPLSRRKEIEFKELKDETIILHPKKDNKDFYETISYLFVQAGIKPLTYVKKDHESCPLLVATGKGVSLTIAATQNFAPTETRFVPIKKLYLPVSVFWENENTNASLKTFLSFVVENHALSNGKPECLMDVMRL